MKSTIILVLFFGLISTVGIAQPDFKKADSLKIVLKQAPNDSIKIRALLGLAFDLSYKNINQSQAYCDQATDLAIKGNWSWAQTLCYSRKAYLDDLKGDYMNSLKNYNKSLEIVLLGSDNSRMASSYINVGNAYIELEKLDAAFFFTKKSIEVATDRRDTISLAIAMHNMAKIFAKFKRMDLALEHFKKSYELSKAVNDLEGPAYNYWEIGNAYILASNFVKAAAYLDSALIESKKFGIAVIIPRVFRSIGEVNYQLKNNSMALASYDSAIIHYRKNQNLFGESRAQLGMSEVFNQQQKFKEAIDLAKASLNTAKNLKAQILIAKCYNTLSAIAESMGNYKEALTYQKNALETQDTIRGINMMSDVFESEFKMLSQKKDGEIDNLTRMQKESEADLRRQEFLRNIFAVVGGLILVLLFSIYRSGKRKAELNQMLMTHQGEIEKRSKELEELNKVKDKFFSIISHDLRSPINSMSGLLALMERNEIKPEELPALTKELGIQFNLTKNLLNNLLDWTLMQMNKVSIRKVEMNLRALIDENIQLLSTVSTKTTTFINSVDESITVMADPNMINLVFRNLMMNGIKFTDNGGTITISAAQENGEISVSVADNGVGISKEVQKVLFEKISGYTTRGTANEKGTGLGLILAKEFIERNGGKISVESEVGKGSTFLVTIPNK